MDTEELTPEMCEAILAMSEWDGPPLVAQGRVRAIAVKGKLPLPEWDY